MIRNLHLLTIASRLLSIKVINCSSLRCTCSALCAGNTALHDCAESGSLEIMQMLLQYGASMEQDGYGMTPLLSASVTGHTNIVEYLTVHEQVRSPHTHVCMDVCFCRDFNLLKSFFFSSIDETRRSHRRPRALRGHLCRQKARSPRSFKVLEKSHGPQVYGR